MFMNKKSQIGATITWITASVIVFFVMLLFIAATIGLAKGKDLFNENKIRLGEQEWAGSLENQRELDSIFSTEIDGVTIRNLITEWIITEDNNKVENKVEEKVESILEEGDTISIYYLFEVIKKGGERISVRDVPQGSSGASGFFYDKDCPSVNLEFTEAGEEINIEFYHGGC